MLANTLILFIACSHSPLIEENAVENQVVEESLQEISMYSPYKNIRKPVVAGSWYPDNPEDLSSTINKYLSGFSPSSIPPKAIIAPHAGYRFSGPTAGSAFAQLKGHSYRRVWIIAPSHRLRLSGIAVYENDAFQTPLGILPVDTAVTKRLVGQGATLLTRGDGGEHALEIELPFLQQTLGSFELVPILTGSFNPLQAQKIAEIIKKELGEGDLIVISTDFTHYGERFGFDPFQPKDLKTEISKTDHQAWDYVVSSDGEGLYKFFENTGATICGRQGLLLLTYLIDNLKATELSYTSSAELTGDYTDSVSYLSARIDGDKFSGSGPGIGAAALVSDKTAQELFNLAEQSLEYYYEHQKRLDINPQSVSEEAKKILGAFVTLEKNGELRGCIGEIVPNRPAYQAVIDRAVDAAINDPRFPKVTKDEIKEIQLDVTLLGPSFEVPALDSFIVGRHGIVLTKGYKRATFLPQVAPEQGWGRLETQAYLARKAGISQQELEKAKIELYEAQVIHKK